MKVGLHLFQKVVKVFTITVFLKNFVVNSFTDPTFYTSQAENVVLGSGL